MNVAVVIVSWNSKSDVLLCLTSVVAASGVDSIVVVDNGSRDGTVRAVRSAYPEVTLLEKPENLGYTGGNNVGLRHALDNGAEYVLLLNDDAVVAPDAISQLTRAAEAYPAAGFLGPNIYALEDRDLFLSSGGVFAAGWHPVHRGLGEEDQTGYHAVAEVDFLSGCALLVRREAVERIGLLDDRFFAYHEDIDWCYRVGQAGFKLMVVPAATVYHPDTRPRDADSPVVTYYVARNSLLFLRKHQMGAGLIVRRLASYAIRALNWSVRPRWRHKRPQRDALVRAIVDFARGRFGRAEWLEDYASR